MVPGSRRPDDSLPLFSHKRHEKETVFFLCLLWLTSPLESHDRELLMIRSCFIASVALMFAVTSPAHSQATTVAGEFSVEPPTLLSLGFDWKITGDDNRNAAVDVSYRKKGAAAWKKGLPLLRLQHEWVNKS